MTSNSKTDDGTDNETLGRRAYLGATGMAAAALSGLAGCLGGSGGDTGTLATEVKDQPGDIADFESCVVTLEGIWVAPSDGGTSTTESTTDETTEDDGREYYQFDEPQEADLVQLQDGNTKLVGEQELSTGDYAFLQLDVTGVDATLEGGGEATVTTPGEAPLKFNASFEIRAEETTTFTADFTPVKRGQTGSYIFQPVASGVSVSYE
jgi:hypothetical protein